MSDKLFVWCNLDKWKKGDMAYPAMAHICVGTHSKLADGSIALTAELSGDSEVDYWVDSLIKDLEQMRKRAKKVIKDKNEYVRASIKQA